MCARSTYTVQGARSGLLLVPARRPRGACWFRYGRSAAVLVDELDRLAVSNARRMTSVAGRSLELMHGSAAAKAAAEKRLGPRFARRRSVQAHTYECPRGRKRKDPVEEELRLVFETPARRFGVTSRD